MRDELNTFDRILADHMRPLLSLDAKSNADTPVFKEIVDRMISSEHHRGDLECIKSAVDKVQLQFKRLQPFLVRLEGRLESELQSFLSDER